MDEKALFKYLRKQILNNTIIVNTLSEKLTGLHNNVEEGKIYELSKLKNNYGIRYKNDKKHIIEEITLSDIILLLNTSIRKIINKRFQTDYVTISIKRED